MSNVQTANGHNESRETSYIVPSVDVIEDTAGITLYADLPGVPKDKLRLQVEHDALIIEGDLEVPVSDGLNAYHTEVDSTRFRRVFTLSKELDAEKISAQHVNGVLKLQIPKAEHAQPKRINVTVN
ncbi:MAG TPA: Hsp20/alpha crystallin family protein [Steroidobacteraceae bacterium]|jgi:HSP20 family molecular chaperone IbpA|nr:Hsp20/alpha crystallin family protein [Steroidobacteraceae bacterium]